MDMRSPSGDIQMGFFDKRLPGVCGVPLVMGSRLQGRVHLHSSGMAFPPGKDPPVANWSFRGV